MRGFEQRLDARVEHVVAPGDSGQRHAERLGQPANVNGGIEGRTERA
jgi:hypothetical protein